MDLYGKARIIEQPRLSSKSYQENDVRAPGRDKPFGDKQSGPKSSHHDALFGMVLSNLSAAT
ncbi:hypothetical protein D4L85_33180 [Chryseolinea soli]|uniref:Uncharacterized protein n=1 Tax=Chryseolinea soli TaxID=2321403 RepID=A0A385SXQ0_9BACT|nr:hypothetical protein D4L85_33180 [Chryseolinea soli]